MLFFMEICLIRNWHCLRMVLISKYGTGERGGVLVKRWTPNREVLSSILTMAQCCVLEQDTLTNTLQYLLNPPSGHDVDWDG